MFSLPLQLCFSKDSLCSISPSDLLWLASPQTKGRSVSLTGASASSSSSSSPPSTLPSRSSTQATRKSTKTAPTIQTTPNTTGTTTTSNEDEGPSPSPTAAAAAGVLQLNFARLIEEDNTPQSKRGKDRAGSEDDDDESSEGDEDDYDDDASDEVTTCRNLNINTSNFHCFNQCFHGKPPTIHRSVLVARLVA